MRNERTTRKSGFTLVELLVVIVIIAMLSGISLVVFRGAKSSVDASVAATEIQQLSMALDQYKAKYGEYPPDFSDLDAVMKHVQKRWPRSNFSDFADFKDSLLTAIHKICGDDTTHAGYNSYSNFGLNAKYSSAMVFWLGGLPDPDTGKPSGFALNPKNPLSTSTGQREEPLYDFDEKKVSYSQGFPVYYLKEDRPLLYFKATENTTGMGAYADLVTDSTGATVKCLNLNAWGVAAPYGRSNGTWYEQDRFQLIYSGADGMFSAEGASSGVIRVADTQQNLSAEDMDNVTNFLSKGNTIEAEKN